MYLYFHRCAGGVSKPENKLEACSLTDTSVGEAVKKYLVGVMMLLLFVKELDYVLVLSKLRRGREGGGGAMEMMFFFCGKLAQHGLYCG